MHSEIRWIHRPLVELLRLAWPIAVSMLSHSVMSIVDTMFVTGIGASALAGVGLAGAAMFTFLCFSIGLLRSVKVLVSQAVGAQRGAEPSAYLSAGLAMGGALGLITIVLCQAALPLMEYLAASVEAGLHASTYLQIRTLSAPMFLIFVALRESCYGRGHSRTPMVASIAANVCNATLDYIFVAHLGWGVAGVAWASVAATTLEMATLLWARGADLRALARPRLRYIAAVWRIGLPTGGQFLLEVGAFALLAAMISKMSEVQMAAHQLVFHLFLLAFLPGHAIAEAGSVLAGQAVGGNRDDLVLGVAWRSALVSGAYSALCTLVVAVAAPAIIAAFTDEAELHAVAVRLMYIGAIFLIADAGNMVARGILRGAADVRYPAVVCIACAWLCTPPLTWLLGYWAGLGAAGAWIGLCFEIAASASILWWRLYRGTWKRSAAASRAEVLAAGDDREGNNTAQLEPARA